MSTPPALDDRRLPSLTDRAADAAADASDRSRRRARRSPTRRLPEWLKRPIPAAGGMYFTKNLVGELGLETICESAAARTARSAGPGGPRRSWSWASVCTRPCGFCAVKRGKPEAVADRRARTAGRGLHRLGLRHVVITSVTRDDLPDGGAEHFRRCVLAVRDRTGATIEVLTPDFDGRADAIDVVLSAAPRGLQPQPGDRRPAPAARPPQEPVRRQPEGPRARQAGRDPSDPDQERPDARPGRDDRGGPRDPGRPPRRSAATSSRSASTSSPRPATSPSCATCPPTSSTNWAGSPAALGFADVASGPFVRSSYHADEMASGPLSTGKQG